MRARVIIKPDRWWWPPDRRKARIKQEIAQYILDRHMPEIKDKINERFIDHFINGKPL